MAFIPPIVSPNPTDVHRNVNEVFLELQTEILSRTSLSSIIQDPRLDLYKEERARIPLEDVIEHMRQDTQISRDAPANTGGDYLPFHITFAYSDRIKTQLTVMALMTRFQDANLTSQRIQAQAKRASTSDRVYRLETRIAVLEKRLGMPSEGHEPDFSSNRLTGLNLDVIDPPSLLARACSSRPRPLHGHWLRCRHSRRDGHRHLSPQTSADTVPGANGVKPLGRCATRCRRPFRTFDNLIGERPRAVQVRDRHPPPLPRALEHQIPDAE